jgi:hypothetical protein
MIQRRTRRNGIRMRIGGSGYRACSAHKKKGPEVEFGASGIYPGGDLRSHTVTRAVSSALRGLTSVFGMGTGVTLAV